MYDKSRPIAHSQVSWVSKLSDAPKPQKAAVEILAEEKDVKSC